jgi:DDE superfamily endonuclease
VPDDLNVHIVFDNYGTHKTAIIQRWLAKRPRFTPHSTPTSASWINMAERFFATLTEQQLRRGTHRSTTQLEAAIKNYLRLYNDDPRPVVWHRRPTRFSSLSPDFVYESLTPDTRGPA